MTGASEDLRETVRARYAAAATSTSCCGAAPTDLQSDAAGTAVFGASLYGDDATEVAGSLGCGVPTAVADLHPGETVLDLGSGAGGDVLISARRVGPNGRAIGLDMTAEMLELARANATRAGLTNVEFLHGYLEEVPLPDDTVDVVISNCVLNLAADKTVALREAARVLRPGGRLAFSDVVADPDMDAATKADMAAWTGCIAGALTQDELAAALTDTGFTQVEIRPTHRVHTHAQAAIIRAVLPSTVQPSTVQPGTEETPMTTTPSVLFVCVKNGGKSQMAAGLMRHAASTTVTVESAGTKPGTAVNALSAQSLQELGIDITAETPKAITDQMIRDADLVITLGPDTHVEPLDGTRVESWDTDEPSERGIDGIERMRLVRDDITARVNTLRSQLLDQ